MHTWQHTMGPALMGESGGDYNALFNYSNRSGGPFAGVNVTDMTIDDLLQFSDPDGPYGQYVKSQIGRVSTPMGGFQVVGSTLRMAKQGLGLKGNEKFDEAMQNRIGEYIFKQQGAGAWEALKKGGGIMNFMPQQAQQPMMPQEEKQGFDFRRFAAALDPLIMPKMRAGDALRAQMEEEKTKKRTNQTVAYLRGLGTAQGEQLAAMVEGGQLKSSDAFRALMQLQQSDRDFEQQKELALFEAGLKGDKTYQYQALANDLLEQGLAKNPAEALQMALSQTKAGTTVQVNTGSTGIDYGDPPNNMAWKRNPDGTVAIDDRGIPIALPIAGTKEDLAQKQVDESKDAIKEQTVFTGGVVLGNIDKIRKALDKSILPATGLVGQLLQNVGGTSALNISTLLDPIRANIGFDRLQKMREASPTGGALGQVTERELDLLMATMSSLNQAQSEDQFLDALSVVEKSYTDIIRKFNAYPAEAMAKTGYTPIYISDTGTPSSGSQTLSDDDLIKKYGG